jgi:hypothetical protein
MKTPTLAGAKHTGIGYRLQIILSRTFYLLQMLLQNYHAWQRGWCTTLHTATRGNVWPSA